MPESRWFNYRQLHPPNRRVTKVLRGGCRNRFYLAFAVLSILNEGIRGVNSIRDFWAGSFISNKHDQTIDFYMPGVICRKCLDTWATFCVDLLTLRLSLVTAMLIVCADENMSFSSTQADLTLNNTTVISRSTYLFTRTITQLQIEMNSIERLKSYSTGITHNPNHPSKTASKPLADFESMQYKNVLFINRGRQDPALNSVNLQLSRGERVGIGIYIDTTPGYNQ